MNKPFMTISGIGVSYDWQALHFTPDGWQEALREFSERCRTATFPGVFFRGADDNYGGQVIGLHLEEGGEYFEGYGLCTLRNDSNNVVDCGVVGNHKLNVALGLGRFLEGENTALKIRTSEIGGVILRKADGSLGVGAYGIVPSLGMLFWR